MKKSNPEDLECEAFKYWLHSKNYRFTHIANEIGVGGLIGIKIGSRNKKIGVSKWFPDYIIFLKNGGILFLEMKLPRKILKNGKLGASPSKISPEQTEWIEFLQKIDNADARIAYGFDEAKEIVERCENFLICNF